MAFLHDRRPRGRSRLHLRLLAGVLAACVLLLGLDGWRTLQERHEVIMRDEAESATLARALAQQALDVVQTVDAAVAGVRERVEHDAVAPADRSGLAGYVERRVQNLPLLGGLSILDAEGRRLFASGGGGQVGTVFAEREYFRFHAASGDRGSHVGPPIRRRLDGAWVFTVSRLSLIHI